MFSKLNLYNFRLMLLFEVCTLNEKKKKKAIFE